MPEPPHVVLCVFHFQINKAKCAIVCERMFLQSHVLAASSAQTGQQQCLSLRDVVHIMHGALHEAQVFYCTFREPTCQSIIQVSRHVPVYGKYLLLLARYLTANLICTVKTSHLCGRRGQKNEAMQGQGRGGLTGCDRCTQNCDEVLLLLVC